MLQVIRGRGAVGKANTLIMAESVPLEDIETGTKSKGCRYFKAKVLDSHLSAEINHEIQQSRYRRLYARICHDHRRQTP